MRKLVWAILFLVLTIVGVTAAVLVGRDIPGIIRVLSPGLAVTPASLDFGTVTVDASSGAAGVASLSIENTGDVALTVTYTCSCQGFSLILTPLPGPLGIGAIWTG